MATFLGGKEEDKTSIFSLLNGKHWSKEGFANWIDYHAPTGTVKYGDHKINVAEVFGLKATRSGGDYAPEPMKTMFGAPITDITGKPVYDNSIGAMAARAQAEANKRSVFTWKNPLTGQSFTEDYQGWVNLPMSQNFAQAISDYTWYLNKSGFNPRYGKPPSGLGKDPTSSKAPASQGKAPTLLGG